MMMSEEDNSWGVITSILDRLGTLVSYSALKMFLQYSAILKSCTDFASKANKHVKKQTEMQ